MKTNHLWNDLPQEERKRLMPHMIESQILYLKQGKEKAKVAHKALMWDFDEHIKNCERELKKLGY